jgi:NTP pyrophosphatase (non-canonical NTP hydrolase)
MEFDEYQEKTKQTAIYPEDNPVEYLAIALNGEAGEVADKVKKSIRDDQELEENVKDEIGDVLWYMARLLDELEISFSETAQHNMDKVLDRKERGELQGSGDNR